MQKQLAIKLLTIVVVGILVLIPASMVKYKIYERQGHLEQARATVAQGWTGPQLVTTPVLVIPYELSASSRSGFFPEGESDVSTRLKILLPDKVRSDISVANETVHKGIYEVAVYSSELQLSGTFPAEKLQQRLSKIQHEPGFVRILEPYVAVHVADVRGIDKAPSLSLNDAQVILNPGSRMAPLGDGLHGQVAVPAESVAELKFTFSMSLRGMDGFSFVHLADDAITQLRSDWPHPEFTGATLPAERDISSSGFTASWTSTRYSNNSAGALQDCLGSDSCQRLLASSSGVRFIEPVDVYLQSERSVKYAVLFIGLSFITFFIFEHLKQTRIHPIQYAFVGLAIAIFYLLLISLAEHIAFSLAYAIAVLCCSALILFYVRYMLSSFLSALLFSMMIAGLYGLLYVIVQAEDFALLMGAILVFLILAVLMYVTRHINWYELNVTDSG